MKFFIWILFTAAAVQAQTIADLESNYHEIHLSLRAEQLALDSLREQLEYSALQIEHEKNQTRPNRAAITEWMTHGVLLSAKIKEHQKIIAILQAQGAQVRDVLDQQYRHKIDSLKSLEKNYQGDRAALQNKILLWAEKRILLSPIVKSLSFDPQRIHAISVAAAADSLERAVYTDYLKTALAEIDGHSANIKKMRQEYEDIVDLRQRTSEFIEDVSEQRTLGFFITSRTEKTSQGTSGIVTDVSHEFISSQAQFVVTLIKQLNTNVPAVSKYAKLSGRELTLEDYIQLLKQAEKELETYRAIIQKKLK